MHVATRINNEGSQMSGLGCRSGQVVDIGEYREYDGGHSTQRCEPGCLRGSAADKTATRGVSKEFLGSVSHLAERRKNPGIKAGIPEVRKGVLLLGDSDA